MESISEEQKTLTAVQTAFKMFDRDGDGNISSAEFRAVMGSLVEKLTDGDAERMLREADKDGDGAISFDEFKAMLLPPDNKPHKWGYFTGEKKPGQTRHLRNIILKEDEPLVSNFRGMNTLKEILDTNVKACPEKPFLGSRAKIVGENGAITFGEYQWKTYAQVYEAARAFANYLMKHNLCPKVTNEEGTFRFIALYAKNRDEWVEADLGSMITATTVVTLYDTLGLESIDFILNQTSMTTVVLSADKIKNIVKLKADGKIPTTTHIIYFDDAKSEDLEAGKAAGLTIVSYAQVIAEGKNI